MKVKISLNSVATNDFGRTERRFRVTVTTRVVANKPILEKGDPGNKTAIVGDNVRLQCRLAVTDESSPPSFTWMRHFCDETGNCYKDNNETLHIAVLQACGSNGRCSTKTDTFYIDEPQVLYLPNVTVNDSGQYSCGAENEYGVTYNTGYLTVLEELPSSENRGSPAEDLAPIAPEPQLHLRVYSVAILAIVSTFLVVSLLVIFARMARERHQKKQSDDTLMYVYNLTKFVVVENQKKQLVQCPDVVAPTVTIEKK